MALLFENVRGCDLTIEDFHSSISFPTPSDALFSSFFIKYTGTVPMSLFDELLALFRHDDFHPDQVTIQEPENIMNHIASERQLIAKERNSTTPKTMDARSNIARYPRISTLIPELLAEYLDSQHLPFHREIERCAAYGRVEPPGETKRTLETMSLVHRSWTDIAQRYLRRRIFISGIEQLPSVFHSPQIGPWVRQLSFHNLGAPHQSQDMPRLLSGILKICPNVTHLHLHNFRQHKADYQETEIKAYEIGNLIKVPHDIIAQLADMKHLQHLWLRQPSLFESDYEDFWRLSMELPRLRFLKSLSIDSMDVPWWRKGQASVNTQAQMGSLIPSSSLEVLSLVKIDLVASGIFTWLMNPLNHIKKLELPLHDGVDNLLPLFSSVTTTHVTTLQFVPSWNAVDVGIALQSFPSVETLSLCADWGEGLPGTSLVLPASILKFHFYYRKLSDMDEDDQDQIALATLKAYRHVQRMLITYSDNFDPSMVLFKDTAEYCASNKVEFKVTRVDECHPPHISEL